MRVKFLRTVTVHWISRTLTKRTATNLQMLAGETVAVECINPDLFGPEIIHIDVSPGESFTCQADALEEIGATVAETT